MNIFITGASGYIGSVLIESFLADAGCEKIIALDVKKLPDRFSTNSNIVSIQANLVDTQWMQLVARHTPSAVVHCAWRFPAAQENIKATEQLTDFVFSLPGCEVYIYLSTVAVYGARKSNGSAYPFREDAALSEREYPYACQKIKSEQLIRQQWNRSVQQKKNAPSVILLRLASVTGESCAKVRSKRISLQSFLRSRVPLLFATRQWCRQFIHEQDVSMILQQLVMYAPKQQLLVLNAAPPCTSAPHELGNLLKKKVCIVHPTIVRAVFFFFRLTSIGLLPFARGAWRFFSYPIFVDTHKLTGMLTVRLRCSTEAFQSSLIFRRQ